MAALLRIAAVQTCLDRVVLETICSISHSINHLMI